ncbi:MAG: DNA helicase, partial [Methylotenera sp.]
FEAALVEPLATAEADIADFTPRLVRLKQPQLPAVLQTEQPVTTGNKQNNKPVSGSVSIEANIGTLAHRYMEIIAQQGLAAWPSSRIALLLPAMRHWLRQQGHAGDAALEAAAIVERLLVTSLSSEDGQWALKARDAAEVELAMTNVLGDAVKNHIVDRTFIEGNIRWIIDYKTVELPMDASQDMLKSTAENYRTQLETYASLFENEGLQVKCAIFFMHIGKLVQLQ